MICGPFFLIFVVFFIDLPNFLKLAYMGSYTKFKFKYEKNISIRKYCYFKNYNEFKQYYEESCNY